ncbi:MAG: HAMP domain-containing histidine kinase, partial [Lachnospiraceae bacterium]|nr:HAMP domain-containing histidine kinase [Lachnospiraceae bacterium]
MALIILMLILLNTMGKKRIYDLIYNDARTDIYNTAITISEEYISSLNSDVFSSSMTDVQSSLRSEFKSFYSISGVRVLLVREKGKIIVDSSDGQLEGENINDYDSSFLSNKYYTGEGLKKIMPGELLYAIHPLIFDQKINGYLVLSTSIRDIENEAVEYTDQIIFCFVIFFIILGFAIGFLYMQNELALYKTTKHAKEYALGHFDYDPGKRPHNDYADIYDALDYMGKKFGNYADQQAKFIANVSHDFRSPLTSIKGYSQAMLDGIGSPEDNKRYLEIIVFETNRLNKMTDNLLQLNNFENNGVQLEMSIFDINSIIRMSVKTFEDRCNKKNISINLTFSSKELMVVADVYKIEQVIQNLTDNAIKFSHNGSSIDISTSSQRNKAFVSVKDYGIGIPKEAQMKIWNRFYKTDLSRGKDKTGSGLGLAIVREIVEAHGENINVISTKGAGTEFIFSLKLKNEED